MRTVHLVGGVAGLVLFVVSGAYMHFVHDHLSAMADGPRLMYRTAHIYLLWAALLNLGLGAYLTPATGALGRRLQAIGTAATLLAPLCIAVSFLWESEIPSLVRPWARNGIYLAAAGTILHVLAAHGRRGA